jgi:hypothetical protein
MPANVHLAVKYAHAGPWNKGERENQRVREKKKKRKAGREK